MDLQNVICSNGTITGTLKNLLCTLNLLPIYKILDLTVVLHQRLYQRGTLK